MEPKFRDLPFAVYSLRGKVGSTVSIMIPVHFECRDCVIIRMYDVGHKASQIKRSHLQFSLRSASSTSIIVAWGAPCDRGSDSASFRAGKERCKKADMVLDLNRYARCVSTCKPWKTFENFVCRSDGCAAGRRIENEVRRSSLTMWNTQAHLTWTIRKSCTLPTVSRATWRSTLWNRT